MGKRHWSKKKASTCSITYCQNSRFDKQVVCSSCWEHAQRIAAQKPELAGFSKDPEKLRAVLHEVSVAKQLQREDDIYIQTYGDEYDE